jgi:hypothetical protein
MARLRVAWAERRERVEESGMVEVMGVASALRGLGVGTGIVARSADADEDEDETG